MYTNTYLAEHNTATHLTELRRDAAQSRLLASLKREERQNEPCRGSSRTWIIGRLARFVLRPATARAIAQA